MASGLVTALALGWLLAFYFTSLEKQRSAMKKRIRRLRFRKLEFRNLSDSLILNYELDS